MTSSPASHGLENDCQHVAASDGNFMGRMRFHQSWYRKEVLQVPPGPRSRSDQSRYGNMLTQEDGARGLNFLTPDVHQYAEKRLLEAKGAIEPDRLRRNMLSSQPLCFNLFAPLALDLELAARLLSKLPGLSSVSCVLDIQVESDAGGLLGDRTAFDAFVDYERVGGGRGFLAVETKLTEPFSPKAYPVDRYQRWFAKAENWWLPGTEAKFPNPSINQLWRNHLLAFALLKQTPDAYQEGFCAVVSHDMDMRCSEVITNYRTNLTIAGDASLLNLKLGDMISGWLPAAPAKMEADWLMALRRRYVDFDESDLAWQAFCAERDSR